MKRTTTLFLTLLLLATTLSAQPKVIAHRGYWRAEGSAQNSIKSFVAAAELGCWGSEFDVWLTADDQLILYHDDSLGGERVEELNYADLADYRLSNGEPLPLLAEFLRVAQQYPDIQLVFELKGHHNHEREMRAVKLAVAMIEQMGLAHRTDYISFSHAACKEFIRLSPQSKVFYLRGELTAGQLLDEGFAGADYHGGIYVGNPKFVDELHKRGLEANIWTINDPSDQRRAIALGVDYITTDYPELLVKEN